ncbi:MAG: polysaccharide biosynthesis protein [Erysipelotrichaceae bacterium]
MLLSFIRRYRILIMIVIDLVVIVMGYSLAVVLKGIGYVPAQYLDSTLMHAMELFPALLAAILLAVKLLGLYPAIWRYTSLSDIIRLAVGVFGAHLLAMFVFYTTNGAKVHESLFLVSAMVIFLGLSTVRIAYRLFTREYNKRVLGQPLDERVVIVGAGSGGDILYREMIRNPHYNVKVVGFLDDNPHKKNWLIHNKPVLGSTYDVEELAKQHHFTKAYIAIPSMGREDMANMVQRFVEAHILVKKMSFSEDRHQAKLEDIKIEDLLGRDEIKLDQGEIGHYIANKTVLVTGAGGSIGSELCRQIIAYKPKALVMLDIYENNLYELQQELKHFEVPQHYLIANVREKHTIEKLFRIHQPELVYHAAAHKHVPLMEDMPKEAIKNNVFGTYNVVNMACRYKAERFTLVSTDKAVNPTNVMGATKRMCELVVQSFAGGETKVGAVRFGNVLGSNGSVIPLFKKQLASGGPLTITHPEIIRYFMLIPEAVSLVLQAGGYADQGEIFVLDMGKPVKIVDLAKNLINLAGLQEGKDIKIEFTGLRPGEKMFEELILDKEQHRKTENALIYVANPIGLEKQEVERRLQRLDAIIKEPMSNVEVKEHLMQLIEV